MVNLNQQEQDNLTSKIMQGKSRIEDYLTLIKVYMVRGEYEQAIASCEDSIKALRELVSLQKLSMHQTVNELHAQGFNVKVVKRSV
ncbi:hypothetical protein [Psychrobacillus sp. FSL K6-1464]|uniref:hypothetical protein n=1 Tax=Psychrobacillus sp. FSL K6-1464 TaxID=2921545 RepID=UPI0030F9609F